MATESSDNAASIDVKTKPDSGATKRAKQLRERLASTDVKRWEIFTTEAIKSKVREIANKEALSVGVAAEALLRLGIETYLSRYEASVECERPVSKPESMAEHFARAQQIISLTSSHSPTTATPTKANQSGQNLRKALATYSSRPNQNIPDPAPTKPLTEVSEVKKESMASAYAAAKALVKSSSWK